MVSLPATGRSLYCTVTESKIAPDGAFGPLVAAYELTDISLR